MHKYDGDYAIVLLRDLKKEWRDWVGKKIRISGWIRTSRSSKNFAFIELNDGTTYQNIQVVCTDQLSNYAEVEKLHISSAIEVYGALIETPDAKQDYEIAADRVVVVGESSSDYPLQKKRHTMEYLRTIAHLRPRSNTFSAVFRVRSEVSFAIHQFFHERGFVYTHAPIITGSDAEGAGEVFRVTTLDPNNLPMK
ncbi:MAG: amino acid--tRNA ligase-related protein, partial [Bacillota bacterium]|nr:amino acid--tRNA ligase-related protein [Bacillota bacterium]